MVHRIDTKPTYWLKLVKIDPLVHPGIIQQIWFASCRLSSFDIHLIRVNLYTRCVSSFSSVSLSVCRRLHQGINAIVDQKDRFIQFPMTADAFRIARQEWVDQGHHFPGAFNIIDCTHIKVLKPGPNLYGDDYINRKQFASINVQVQ